jgi:adenylylsulfate kinase
MNAFPEQPYRTAVWQDPAFLSNGAAVWLTGLSGAGKTTIAEMVFDELQRRGYRSELLDADVLRNTLTRGLGYSREDREENIRRIGFAARLLARQGVIVIVAAITPYRSMRQELRRQIETYIEVYVDAPLDECERRDPKGLYKKARAGEIANFTGIDDPYEEPFNPDLHCYTSREAIHESAAKTLNCVLGIIDGPGH